MSRVAILPLGLVPLLLLVLLAAVLPGQGGHAPATGRIDAAGIPAPEPSIWGFP